jgi:hypothetical protein
VQGDLGIITARFSSDTFYLAVSTDGIHFTPFVRFGPELGVGTGVTNSYFYGGHFGLFEVHLFVTPVDLSVFGIDLDATVSAIKVTSSDQGDLIRVAGFAEGGRSDSPAHSRRKTGKLASIPLPGVEDRSDGSAL